MITKQEPSLIYPQCRPDYYNKLWNPTEYQAQVQILTGSKGYLAASEDGFERINLLQRIFEFIAGFFGWEDNTNAIKVQSAYLKFLYFGEAHGFLKSDQIELLKNCMSPAAAHSKAIFENFFKVLNNRSDPPSLHLKNLREIVTAFHTHNRKRLKPGFWFQLFHDPTLNPKKWHDFGDTYLELSEQAKDDVPEIAYEYLLHGMELMNDSLLFYDRLVIQLDSLNSYFPKLLSHHINIQTVWIKIAQAYFNFQKSSLAIDYLFKACKINPRNTQTRLQIGSILLYGKNYQAAKDFLKDFDHTNEKNPELFTHIGQAYEYWNIQEKAIHYYEKAISAYPEKISDDTDCVKVASLYAKLALLHIPKKGIFYNGSYTQCVSFYEKAFNIDRAYAEQLFDTYLKAAEAGKDYWEKMSYYVKAFYTFFKEGPYVDILMELNIEHRFHENALNLYNVIQKQPWGSKFQFSPAAFFQLYKQFKLKSNSEEAFRCIESAYQLESSNQKYKLHYFQFILDSVSLEENQLNELLKQAEKLSNFIKLDFKLVEKLKVKFYEKLAKIYRKIGNSYLQECMVENTYEKREFKQFCLEEHIIEHLNAALSYYNQSLQQNDKQAEVYFEKGLLFEHWFTNYSEAIKCYQSAVKYNPQNLFYKKSLLLLEAAMSGSSPVFHEGSPDFQEDYGTWSKEVWRKNKTSSVNPHQMGIENKNEKESQNKRWYFFNFGL